MKRPIGVTVGVVVALLGSILALVFAVGAIATLFIQTPPRGQSPGTLATIVSAIAIAGVAAVGVWTAVGLFKLRPWARTSIQVLALFVALGCGFMLLVMMMFRPPADMSKDTYNAARIAIGLAFGLPFLVSAWILLQFNTAATKAAFASGAGADPSPRPLSITFIAWSNLLGGLAFLFAVVGGGEGFLLGLMLPSAIARLYYAGLAALSFYIGKGLLDLRERSREIAIGWSAFTLLNAAAVFLPSVQRRFIAEAAQNSSAADSALPFSPRTFITVVFGAMALSAAVTIWFLAHHRDVFVRTENSRFLARLDQG